MTEQDWTCLETYLTDALGPQMELADWRVTVDRKPTEYDVIASIRPTYGQRAATLSVCEDFRDLPAHRAQKALVHELLHCHAAHEQHLIQDDRLKDVMGLAAYRMFRAAYELAHESGIDAIARLLAPKLPPLEWPERGDKQ